VNQDTKETVCEWEQAYDDCYNFSTDCGNYFSLNVGFPSDNGMEYCCYCGKKLTDTLWKLEKEGETK